jgi:hypothetical protein
MVVLSSTGFSLGYTSQLDGNPYVERVSLGFLPFSTEKGRLRVGHFPHQKASVAHHNRFLYSLWVDQVSKEENVMMARAKLIDNYGRFAVKVNNDNSEGNRVNNYGLGKIYLFTEGKALPMSGSFLYSDGVFDDVDRCVYGGMMGSNIIFNGLRFWPYSQIEWLKDTWKNHYNCSDRIPLPMEFGEQTMTLLDVLYNTLMPLSSDNAKLLYERILHCLEMRLYYLENHYSPIGKDGRFYQPILLFLGESIFLAAYRAYLDSSNLWSREHILPALVFVRGRLVRESKDHIVRGVHFSSARVQSYTTRILSKGFRGDRLSKEPVHEIMLESIAPIKNADYWVFMVATGFLPGYRWGYLDPVISYFSAFEFHSKLEKFLLELGLKFRWEWMPRFRDPERINGVWHEIRRWFYDRGFNIKVWDDENKLAGP